MDASNYIVSEMGWFHRASGDLLQVSRRKVSPGLAQPQALMAWQPLAVCFRGFPSD